MLVRYLCRRDVELKRLQMYSGVPTIPQLDQDPSVRAAAPYLTALQKAYKNGFAVRPSTETGKCGSLNASKFRRSGFMKPIGNRS